MMEKKKIYFVGNAHLDPIWLWRWQEGSAEAKATIRSALDRMKEYPEFKFVCSSASVYQWIEEFDPAMFEEVKARVAEGRFVIVGGWHVQPDCNMPAGESFARQSLYSQRYFQEKLGKTATVGYNVDSFGHNGMMPQILKKSGMDQYVFMRPSPKEKEMPSELFLWQSPDGSTVTAWRILVEYATNFKNMEDLELRFAKVEAEMKNSTDSLMYFYGVGNHGGGPTKKNIETALEYQKLHPENEVIFSDITDFFEHIKPWEKELPVHKDDLQHHASGCYSAYSSIKNGMRRAEHALYGAEVFHYMANRMIGKKYDGKAFEEAWKNVMFCQFHDSLDGCCVKDGYIDVEHMMGAARDFASKTENNALQCLSWRIDTSDAEQGYPVIFFNPHEFEVETLAVINKQVPWVSDGEGKRLPIQWVHSQAFSCKTRSDTAFLVKVPAMGYATYFIKGCEEEPFEEDYDGLSIDGTSMENEHLRVEFEAHTGYIKSIYDKTNERELLNGYGAVPRVIDEFDHDAWSHALNYFDREMAKFGDAQLTVVEQGPLRVTMKVVNRYNDSTLTQYFSLTRDGKTLDVKASIDWHEKHKMLKLAYQTAMQSDSVYYEIPFGVIERPANGEEEPGLRWIAMREEDGHGLALLNNNKYSFSVKGGEMNLTVVRSPIFADHGRGRDEECEFTDQGRHDFEYKLCPVCTEGWGDVIRQAKAFNLPLTYIMENNHKGTLAQNYSGFACDKNNIALSAIKCAEDGEGIVVRAYETDGVPTKATLSGGLLPKALTANFGAYSVNTYYYSPATGEWKEVLFTEYDA